MRTNIEELKTQGFSIIKKIYSRNEVDKILELLKAKDFKGQFGVRYFLKENPEFTNLIFNKKLKSIIQSIDKNAFVVKSIYFDKPPNANWIVNWHQDITINVKGKSDAPNYTKWRTTKGRTAVQPPTDILENMFTIRIHLDDCTIENGALRVVPKSHLNGVCKLNEVNNDQEQICEVQKGGILLMKPLIFHSSRRAENERNRRVVHIEFSSRELVEGVDWMERFLVFT